MDEYKWIEANTDFLALEFKQLFNNKGVRRWPTFKA
jgi:hypothetical protein